jgi:DNA-binding MarR family transcriptional regulator
MKLHKIYTQKKIKNPYEDGLKLGEEIKKKIGKPSLIVFITTVFDKERLMDVFEGMKQHIPLDGLIGCSAGGIFIGHNYIKKDGVLILAFDRYFKYATAYRKIENSPEDTGKSIVFEIKNTLRKKYVNLDIDDKFLGFAFYDWDANHEHEILEALGNGLNIPMIGGTASDDNSFDKHFLIYKGEIVKDGCVFGVIGGKLKFDLIYGHGYKTTGVYARVTKAEGRVVYELDGKPAYQRYLEMISKYTKLPEDVVKRYLKVNKKERLEDINLYLVHPLGVMNPDGVIITAFLEDVDGDNLIFRRKIPEGVFLILMKTSLDDQIKALFDKVESVEMNYKNSLIFINECYGIEILKNPGYRKDGTNTIPYFSEFYNHVKDSEYILGDNCIGWLSYGESISKDIMRFHNNLSFTGVVFELEDIYFDWREGLKNFNFTEEEIEVIVNLMYGESSINDLSDATKIPKERLFEILERLEKKGVVKYLHVTETYYIDSLKDALRKIADEIDLEYAIKREGRERMLRML